MDDSVLNEIKKLAGLSPEDDSFDQDLILYLNGLLLHLKQLGITLVEDAIVTDTATIWSDLIDSSVDIHTLFTIKMFLSSKVRKLFDPPQSGTAMQALDSVIAEYEWRLNVAVDPADSDLY